MADNRSTPADRRFTQHRANGNTGWLNADGETPTEADTSPETLEIYERAARSFARHRTTP